MNLKSSFFLLSLICCVNIQSQIITISSADEKRANEIVQKMTLEEKIDYIGGYNSFSIMAIPRLGLPEIKMADGPQGIRNDTKSTLYPCGILSASTWNRSLVNELGKGLGRDARARDIGFLLGPGVNIYRSPLCGRNFEYFGEDPYLAGETAKNYVIGVQSQGVISTIKHFAANNQEWNRYDTSSDVDERTMNEIYLPVFKKAVKQAGVGAVMNSYNLINSVHATENEKLNIEILRNSWGFKGILMSDWVSVHSAVGAATGGLDLEMPSGRYMNKENLIPAVKNGIISESVIDLKVKHILQTLSAFGLLDRKQQDSSIAKDNAESKFTALKLAREGIVLLKNKDNVLPLNGNIVVLGPNSDRIVTGGGSGFVTPYSTVTEWEGIHKIFGKRAELLSDDKWCENEILNIHPETKSDEYGFKAEYFNNTKLQGAPTLVRIEKDINNDWEFNSPAENINKDGFSVRWSGVYMPKESGVISINMKGDDGYRVFINGKQLISDWGEHAVTSKQAMVNIEAGKQYNIMIEYYDNDQGAVAIAKFEKINDGKIKSILKKYKNVVLCVGLDSGLEYEGGDRPFALPEGQNILINKVASMHKNVVVVVNAGGGIDFTKWIDNVQGVLLAWYPGQEGGNAVGEILSGKVNPSGKLPATIEKRWEDNPVFNSYYDKGNDTYKRVQYSEGIFVGYRGYEKNNIKPLFPFGFGLSYTTFKYDNLNISKKDNNKVNVEFDIKNTGKVAGAEVAQVYVRDIKSSVLRPVKELKGYEKVYLKKGETKHVVIELDSSSFAFYDVNKHDFIIESGSFEIMVGSSSDNILMNSVIEM